MDNFDKFAMIAFAVLMTLVFLLGVSGACYLLLRIWENIFGLFM